MQIRIRETGQVLLDHEWTKWVAVTYGKSVGPITTEVLEMFDSDPLLEGPQAVGGNQYQYSMQQGFEQVDGKWFTKYVLGPIFVDTETQTAQEQEAAYRALKDQEQSSRVRDTRNQLLKDCDWTQGKDIPDSISSTWAQYRQQLRDIPMQSGFPWQVAWPAKPE